MEHREAKVAVEVPCKRRGGEKERKEEERGGKRRKEDGRKGSNKSAKQKRTDRRENTTLQIQTHHLIIFCVPLLLSSIWHVASSLCHLVVLDHARTNLSLEKNLRGDEIAQLHR